MNISPDTPQNKGEMISRALSQSAVASEARQWAEVARQHIVPENRKSILQLLTTIPPLLGLMITMYGTVEGAYWLTLLLSIPAAAFMVRLFAIQHDCGHRSFFKSRRLNDWIGNLIGVITLTPHAYWRYSHNTHHATCGNLEKRGLGDIKTLTVAEYLALSRWQRLVYRLYRNPLVMLGIGPVYLFVIKYRLPFDLLRRNRRLLIGVMITNLAIAAILSSLSFGFGFIEVLMVQTPIVVISSTVGIWLFYVQHQFENTYWRKDKNWDFHEASVMSSSYYDLPQPLRWFSANIGIHHIHHLSSRIPNYNLRSCLDDLPMLQKVNRISLWESLSLFRFSLWDEWTQSLRSFKSISKRD
ncbi:MAG: fatty acid desaturase [Proteobacteria bacterium]|nr:fatty acid desaturase [Pseudomonadota bacterium]